MACDDLRWYDSAAAHVYKMYRKFIKDGRGQGNLLPILITFVENNTPFARKLIEIEPQPMPVLC